MPDGRSVRWGIRNTSVDYNLHLPARTGLKTKSVYSVFDKEPFGSKHPREMVFAAQKA